MQQRESRYIFFFLHAICIIEGAFTYRGDASIVDTSVFFRRMAAHAQKKRMLLQVITARSKSKQRSSVITFPSRRQEEHFQYAARKRYRPVFFLL